MACLMSRFHGECVGRLLQHGGIRQSIVFSADARIIPLTTGSMKVGVDRLHPDSHSVPAICRSMVHCSLTFTESWDR